MTKIYAFFLGGPADGESHPVEGIKITPLGVVDPPEKIAADNHIYVLGESVKGVSDSYTYYFEESK